jgi:hypothetical protein
MAGSRHERDKEIQAHIKLYAKNLKGRDHLGELDLDRHG